MKLSMFTYTILLFCWLFPACTAKDEELSFPQQFDYKRIADSNGKIYVFDGATFSEISPTIGRFANFKDKARAEISDVQNIMPVSRIRLLSSSTAELSNHIAGNPNSGSLFTTTYSELNGLHTFSLDTLDVMAAQLIDQRFEESVIAYKYSYKQGGFSYSSAFNFETRPVEDFTAAKNDIQHEWNFEAGDTVAIQYFRLIYE
jgi:hypothetical protein